MPYKKRLAEGEKLSATSWYMLLVIVTGIPWNFVSTGGSRDYIIGDWLISYSGGFVRRGLGGSLLHFLQDNFAIQPLSAIKFISAIAVIFLGRATLSLLKTNVDKGFILSGFFILSPIIGMQLLRKDTILTSILFLSMSMIGKLSSVGRRQSFFAVIAAVNACSIIGILLHEAYGFFAIPAIIGALTIIIALRSREWLPIRFILRSALATLPTICVFILVLWFNGNSELVDAIINSWHDYLASFGQDARTGMQMGIQATSGSMQNAASSVILIFKSNSGPIWTPAAWALTVYACINLFCADKKEEYASCKRVLILLSFLSVLPLFLLGVDYGRWVFFMSAASLAFYGFLMASEDRYLAFARCMKDFVDLRVVSKIAPGWMLNRDVVYAFIGVPPFAWSLKSFVACTPIWYPLGMAKQIFLGIHT